MNKLGKIINKNIFLRNSGETHFLMSYYKRIEISQLTHLMSRVQLISFSNTIVQRLIFQAHQHAEASISVMIRHKNLSLIYLITHFPKFKQNNNNNKNLEIN